MNVFYSIFRNISFDLDIVLSVKILKDVDFYKYLPQFRKTLYNVKVRQFYSSTPYMTFIKSSFINLANFLLLFLLLQMILLLLTRVNDRVLANWQLVFNIDLSEVVILLKF